MKVAMVTTPIVAFASMLKTEGQRDIVAEELQRDIEEFQNGQKMEREAFEKIVRLKQKEAPCPVNAANPSVGVEQIDAEGGVKPASTGPEPVDAPDTGVRFTTPSPLGATRGVEQIDSDGGVKPVPTGADQAVTDSENLSAGTDAPKPEVPQVAPQKKQVAPAEKAKTPEEQAFALLDKNGSGGVNSMELYNGLKKDLVGKMKELGLSWPSGKKYDVKDILADTTGKRLMKLYAEIKGSAKVTVDPKKKIDHIEYEQWRKWLKAVGAVAKDAAAKDAVAKDAAAGDAAKACDTEKCRWERVFNKIDTNGSGRISQRELNEAILKVPEFFKEEGFEWPKWKDVTKISKDVNELKKLFTEIQAAAPKTVGDGFNVIEIEQMSTWYHNWNDL